MLPSKATLFTLEVKVVSVEPGVSRADSGRTNRIALSPALSPRGLRPRSLPNLVSITAKDPLASLTVPANGLFSPTKDATNAVAGSS